MGKTSYRVLNLTVACMLLLSIAAQRVIAWPCTDESCGTCETCTETGCECKAQCGCGGRTCSGCCKCVNCKCVDDDSKCDPPYHCEDCGCVPCWTLETGDPFQYGSCYCDNETATCEGEVQTGYDHSCKLASAGSRECVYRLNQPIGWTWDCEASTNWCGVLACAALNAGVCAILCGEAATACAAMCAGMGGVPECTYAAMDCWDCLTGEGIDCGCLVITCVPSEKPSGIYYGGDNILQGGSCP